jgi:hypothetical protein
LSEAKDKCLWSQSKFILTRSEDNTSSICVEGVIYLWPHATLLAQQENYSFPRTLISILSKQRNRKNQAAAKTSQVGN